MKGSAPHPRPLSRKGRGEKELMPVAVAVRDALEEALLLVGQRLLALAGDLLQKLVHAALVGLLLVLLALELAGGAALRPALIPIEPAPRRGGARRLVALQAGVTLGKIVPEERFLAAALAFTARIRRRSWKESALGA